jgi:hypothetical protein
MKYSTVLIALVVVASPALLMAQPIELQVSLGTRETGAGGSQVGFIGDNGGASGSIEWVDLDNQVLVLDDTWQQFTFDMDALPLSGFTGDGILDGDYGTIEHIRFKATSAAANPITLWIDDLVDRVGGPVPPATDVPITGWEGFADGDEVAFQEPPFSGSTGALIDSGTAGVDNTVAYSGSASYKVEWSWVAGADTNWLRLTTFNALNVPNPVIRYDQNSIVSFWVKGVPEPTSLMLLGLGALLLRRR